jgi:hypothetical protein
VLFQEVENKIVRNHAVTRAIPATTPFFEDAIDRHEQTLGQTPKNVATDRGFSNKDKFNLDVFSETGVMQLM